MDRSEEWEFTEVATVLEENLSLCHLVHQKMPHELGSNPSHRSGKPAINSLSYVMNK
jgi:hypothetical protein